MAAGGVHRKAPIRFDLSGVEGVEAVLQELGKAHGATVERKLARAALGAGLTEAAKIIREAAPEGRLKKSVGKRFGKNRRSGVHEAKAGLNVAGKAGTAPHAHFFTLGTRRRKNKKGQDRGFVPANRFVRRAIQSGGGRVRSAMLLRIKARLPIEVANLRRRFAKAAVVRLPQADSHVIVGGSSVLG